MWRIRDVYPGSDFFPSRILTVFIPDPGSSSKNFSILTPKKAKKWFLRSKKYDPGCSSQIPDPDADFLPSRIQGSKRHPIPDPGSGSATLIYLMVSDMVQKILSVGYNFITYSLHITLRLKLFSTQSCSLKTKINYSCGFDNNILEKVKKSQIWFIK